MKFAKYLDSEAVPEWKSKYVNYKAGKKILKLIRIDTELANSANNGLLEPFTVDNKRGKIAYSFTPSEEDQWIGDGIGRLSDKEAMELKNLELNQETIADKENNILKNSILQNISNIKQNKSDKPLDVQLSKLKIDNHLKESKDKVSTISLINGHTFSLNYFLIPSESILKKNESDIHMKINMDLEENKDLNRSINSIPMNKLKHLNKSDINVDTKSKELNINNRTNLDEFDNKKDISNLSGLILFDSEIKFFNYIDSQRYKVMSFFESQMEINRGKLQMLEQQVNLFLEFKNKLKSDRNMIKKKQSTFIQKNNLVQSTPNGSNSNVKNDSNTNNNNNENENNNNNNKDEPFSKSVKKFTTLVRKRLPFSFENGTNINMKEELTNSFNKKSVNNKENDLENNDNQKNQINTNDHNIPNDVLIGKLRKADRRQLEYALTEFYRGLEILNNYKILNHTAFVKILKKYDKTAYIDSSMYLYHLTPERFCNSEELNGMMYKVENFYINAFASGKRHLGMKRLREITKRHTDYSLTTFFVGICLGISIACFVATCVIAHQNWNNVPYSFELLLVLSGFYTAIVFIILFGINLYVWTVCNINYKFIFETESSISISYQQHFLISSGMLLLASICSLLTFLNPFDRYGWAPQIWPVVLLLSLIFIIGNPFPIFHRESRMWFLNCLKSLVISPFCKVEFSYFFLGDELVSNVYSFSMIYLFSCSYAHHWPANLNEVCNIRTSWWVAGLTALPPYWRFMQCIRRYHDTKMINPHLLNMIKYGLQVTTTFISFAYKNTQNKGLLIFWCIIATSTAIYATYWDYCKDWGLFQPNSKHKYLRDDLLYPWKWYYYFAIITNFPLRMVWVCTVSYGDFKIFPNPQVVVLVAAFLEVFRRIQWNLFRLENEQCNNCGMFRAVKDVPLPFDVSKYSPHYINEEDEEEYEEYEDKIDQAERSFSQQFSFNNNTITNNINEGTIINSNKEFSSNDLKSINSKSNNLNDLSDEFLSPLSNSKSKANLKNLGAHKRSSTKISIASHHNDAIKNFVNRMDSMMSKTKKGLPRTISGTSWKAVRDYETDRTYSDYVENMHNVAIDHIVDRDSNDGSDHDGLSDDEDYINNLNLNHVDSNISNIINNTDSQDVDNNSNSRIELNRNSSSGIFFNAGNLEDKFNNDNNNDSKE